MVVKAATMAGWMVARKGSKDLKLAVGTADSKADT